MTAGAFSLLACLCGGVGLGWAYFNALWWNLRIHAAGGRTWIAVALVVGRFALLGGVLTLVSLEGGALPLLVTALGILIASPLMMRRVRDSPL